MTWMMDMSSPSMFLLLSVAIVFMLVLVSSLDRSAGRKEVSVKVERIRKRYLRLRVRILCKW